MSSSFSVCIIISFLHAARATFLNLLLARCKKRLLIPVLDKFHCILSKRYYKSYFHSFQLFRSNEVKIYTRWRTFLNFFDTKSLTLRIYDIFARIARNVYCYVIRLRRRKENSTKFSYVRVKTKIGANLWCGNRLGVSFHVCVDAVHLRPRVEKNVQENEMRKEIEFSNAHAFGRREVALRNGTETPVSNKEEDLVFWFQPIVRKETKKKHEIEGGIEEFRACLQKTKPVNFSKNISISLEINCGGKEVFRE